MGAEDSRGMVAENEVYYFIAQEERRGMCPKCGGIRILRNGTNRYLCGDCGKQWTKRVVEICPHCGQAIYG